MNTSITRPHRQQARGRASSNGGRKRSIAQLFKQFRSIRPFNNIKHQEQAKCSRHRRQNATLIGQGNVEYGRLPRALVTDTVYTPEEEATPKDSRVGHRRQNATLVGHGNVDYGSDCPPEEEASSTPNAARGHRRRNAVLLGPQLVLEYPPMFLGYRTVSLNDRVGQYLSRATQIDEDAILGVSPSHKRVRFNDIVSTAEIPHRGEYNAMKDDLWVNRKTHSKEMARNHREYYYEGRNWRGVLTEKDFVRLVTGELVHPATFLSIAELQLWTRRHGYPVPTFARQPRGHSV